MSSLSGLSSIPPTLQAAPTQQPGSLVSFGSMGVPGLNGGYAYPPGSEMASFMDSINSTVAAATVAPDGSSDILTWANGLAQQAALRQQQQAQQAQALAAQSAAAGGDSGNNMMQMLQSLLSMLISQLSSQNGTGA
jgi:hypothetical protein